MTGMTFAVAVVALTACGPTVPMPVPTFTPSESASPTAQPVADPVLRPGRNAAANQQYFDFVNEKFFAAYGMGDSKSIIDNLVSAGFSKQDMQVTDDTTAIGEPVDSIVFAVRINSDCLIGQFAGSGYTGTVAGLLGTGSCLVGNTLPIDW